ncbi:MAG TPA: MoaD/ThiS family protein [Pirellulales bacterium]|jgi:molybdopterin converting factor small subunit|nr:MoaD/ThiS family protein [Pirellulales bacterium]
MKLVVKLFALAKELYGDDKIAVELPPGATVGDLRVCLSAAIPALSPLIAGMLIAVNSEYALDRSPLAVGDEVACIPPVSGG